MGSNKLLNLDIILKYSKQFLLTKWIWSVSFKKEQSKMIPRFLASAIDGRELPKTKIGKTIGERVWGEN